MTGQGRCTLPANDAGQVRDRVAALEQCIRPAQVEQALQATGRHNARACLLPQELMLWVVLGMGLLTDLPVRQVFKHLRRLRAAEKTPGRSALCQARQRLG